MSAPEPAPVLAAPRPRRRRPWRATLQWIHRDLGFLAVGLTLVYAISGIAVNHRADWDYNRTSSTETVAVGTPAALLSELPADRRAVVTADPTAVTDAEVAVLAERVGAALGRQGAPKNLFWRGPDHLSLHFATGGRDVVEYALSAGTAEATIARDRFLLRELNFLHLNEGRRGWTWVADAYAVVLVFLAVSGAIIVKGKKGLRGRGGVLVALGVLIPLVAVWLLRG